MDCVCVKSIEALFRSVKSVLQTRPIHHQRDDTIRGRVFSSCLVFVLLKALEQRMHARGFSYEGARLGEELDDLAEIRLEAADRQVLVRSIPRSDAGRALQAAGVALGPAVSFLEPESNQDGSPHAWTKGRTGPAPAWCQGTSASP